MGKFTIAGNAQSRGNNNQTLVEAIRRAAASSPYDVELFSGIRYGGKRGQHHHGRAVDIVLKDPVTGAEIPNLASSIGFPAYEQFAREHFYPALVEIAPEQAPGARWGGWMGPTGPGGLNPSGFDLMHFDLKGTGNLPEHGSWATGTTAAWAARAAQLGPGQYYSSKGTGRPAPADAYNGGIIGPGSPRDVVMQIQSSLAAQGIEVGIDGIWGPQTADAVKQFQQSAGVPATGYVDTSTSEHLTKGVVNSMTPAPDALAPGAGLSSPSMFGQIPQERILETTQYSAPVGRVAAGAELGPPPPPQQNIMAPGPTPAFTPPPRPDYQPAPTMGVAPPMAGMDAPFTPPPRPDESAPAPASPYGDPRLPQARPDYAPPSPYGDPRIPTARPPQTQDRASAALEAVLAPPVTSVTSPPAMPDAGQMPGPALESVRLPEGSSSSSAPPLQVAEMPAPQQPGPDLSLAPYETQRNDTSMGVPPAMAGIEAPASIEERLASAALPPTGTEFFRGDGAAFVPLGETIARPMQEQAPPDLAGEFDASTPAAAPPPQMPTGGPGTFAPFANGWQDPSLAEASGMGGISTPAERMGAAFPQSAPPSALVQAAQDRATPPAAPIASPPAESSWAESILGAPRALADSIGLTTPTVSALPFGARTGLDAVNSQGAATATPLPYLPAQPAAPQPAAAAPAWPTEIGRNPFDTMRGVTTYLPPAERTYETPVTSPPAALPQQPVGQVQPPGTPAPAFSTPPTQVESMPVYSPPPAELAPTPPAAPAATFTPGADNMGAWSQGPMTLDHATQEQKDALGRMAGVRRPGSRWGAAAKGALFGGSFLGLPGAAVGGVIGGIFGGTGLQGLRQPPQAMALPQQPVVNVDGSIVGGNIWNGGIARSGDPFGGRGVSHGGGSYSYGGSYTGGDPRAGQPPGQPSGSYFGGSPTVGGMPGYASDYNN